LRVQPDFLLEQTGCPIDGICGREYRQECVLATVRETALARVRQLILQQMAVGEASPVGLGTVPPRVVRESERESTHARTLLPDFARVPTGLLSLRVLKNSYHLIPPDIDWHLVADQLSAFVQGMDTCNLDSVRFEHVICSAVDVLEAAIAP
jgi:hypothetical protein